MDNHRDIWRGKRIDNGEWVEGLPVKMWGAVHLQNNENENLMVQVIPETLGECTGLTDKNGVKIFEGDIIQTKYGRLCEVVWRSNSAVNCWDITPLECMHRSPDEWDLWDSKNLSVVGNIRDNPELLEGGENNG